MFDLYILGQKSNKRIHSDKPHRISPPVLWSPIRLGHWPNYSQSQAIKSNYNQLWVIWMPRRLIAPRDVAVSCHFQETGTLIRAFFCLAGPTLSMYKCFPNPKEIPLRGCQQLQKNSEITEQPNLSEREPRFSLARLSVLSKLRRLAETETLRC